MTEVITLPEAWVKKGTFLKITVYIEDGVLKRTVTDRRFSGKTPSKKRKLTDYQADKIREEFARGSVTKASLGKKFGVSERTIRNIIAGRGYV